MTASAADVCTATLPAYTAGGHALFANGAGALITVPHDVTVNAAGNLAGGGLGTAVAANGGALNFQRGLTLTQNGRHNTYGLAAPDVASGGAGRIHAQDVNIVMGHSGLYRRAVMALGTEGEVHIAGKATITATGNGEHRGLSAEDGGVITYGAADIDFTNYDGSAALRVIVRDPKLPATVRSTLTANGRSTLKVSGARSSVAFLSRADVKLQALDVTAAAGAQGVEFSGPGSFSAEGGTIGVADGGSAFFYAAAAGASSVVLKNVAVEADANSFLWNSAATAAVTFQGVGGSYTGRSKLAAGAALNVGLENGARWAMTADSQMSLLTLTGSARLEVTDSHTLTANAHNTAGVVSLQDGDANDTLTVDGGYEGGGSLALDTALGAGPVGADVLRVTGDVAGAATRIKMRLTAGAAGAATAGNGILVVQVAGASPAGAFVLDGPVWHGGYLYELKQIGNDWFLQSRAAPAPVVKQVPTLQGAGLIALALLLALGTALGLRRQRG
ncbi:autotransporter outer membrane beta-barrel domain-containing protein [Allofranklinella schreckenbergeri]|uniref:autotransporter outer membrane beta-barrel domain-containing protein n=1 Tax=Allofranklinella schreckenbergeri TaxID=1076744 RepID=UPI001EED2C20|nr:autotransporter outer membrane beta-barrel domain-containing protein [Allofranklinella schreckenbergeri]